MKKKILMGLAAAFAALTAQAQQAWKDTSLSFHERAKSLVAAMTLDEKIGQVGHQTAAISRLGLKGYNYWSEALHGVARSGLATSFPESKAMSATWDLQLIFDCASATSDEARVYNNKQGKGLVYWCPTINMSRDPRWGRDEEDYGEDPYLCGRLAVEYVKGMQGDDPKYYKTIATAKHFAANNYEKGRHSTSSDMDMRNLREYYLPAFEMCVKEANVRSIMSAYNALNGVPCGASHELLVDILRTEWGFSGFVTSDCGAIDDIFQNHKYVGTGAEASAVAMRNGEDLNCGDTFQKFCKEAIQKGLLTEAELDTALVRVLEARFSVGEFDSRSEVKWQQTPDSMLNCQKHKDLALKAAQESIVLLKNAAPSNLTRLGEAAPLLPLKKDQTVCVVGPFARTVTLGGYSGSPTDLTTPLEGIAQKMGVSSSDGRTEFEDCDGMSTHGTNHLVIEANGSAGNLGYIHSGDWVSFSEINFGQGVSKLTINSAAQNSNPTIVRIYLDSRTKSTPDMQVSLPATGSWSTYQQKTFNVDPEVFNGTHKVYFSFYFTGNTYGANMDWFHFYNTDDPNPLQSDGPLYYVRGCNVNDTKANDFATAREFAAKADVVVLCLGTDLETSDEGHDRSSLNLPGGQQQLLQEVCSVNKNVVLVLQTCSSMTIGWAKQNVPAIVEAWYGGQAQGRAIADVLYGDYNPSGKLTSTWYNSLTTLPSGMLQYDIRKGHYTYMYHQQEPLFPFGYGLSYTSYEYSNLSLSSQRLGKGETITVSFDVKNTGERDGDEIVQLYTHAQSQLERPLKELKGFDRISLKAGETRHVEIPLIHDQLCYFNEQTNTYDVEEGTVDVMIGASSADIRLQTTITTEGAAVKGTYLHPLASNIKTETSHANARNRENVYDMEGRFVGTLDDYSQLPKGLLLTGNHKFVKKIIQ
ncbi:MAG: glycoside hydrolase family 3 C-terminal domain-containing protein [Prevotella sp.]|nr:glycoside hydrolase family 3 C-terminal domain-containing protein [Prevotella sp.]